MVGRLSRRGRNQGYAAECGIRRFPDDRTVAQDFSRNPPGSSSHRCTAEAFHPTVRRVSDTCLGNLPSPISRYSDDRGRPVRSITEGRRKYPSLIRAIPILGLPADVTIVRFEQKRKGGQAASSTPMRRGRDWTGRGLLKGPSAEAWRIIEIFKAPCVHVALTAVRDQILPFARGAVNVRIRQKLPDSERPRNGRSIDQHGFRKPPVSGMSLENGVYRLN